MASELELVFRPQVQQIFDHFCALHRIRIAFFSPEGAELRAGKGWGSCRYCGMLRNDCGYEQECRALDARRREEAAQRGDKLISYQCHGGMTEAVMPMRVNGRLLGFVMIGQFRSQQRVPVKILQRVPRRAAARLQTLFDQAPFYSQGQAQHVLGLLEVLVRYIADQQLISGEDALAPILQRLRERPQERLSLGEAAAMIGRSPSTLSHLFKHALGKSFRQVRVDCLLEAADRQLRGRPGVSVKQVAAALGITDPLYFSRLYRRHRGVPPSRART